jgi:hypothetical protein
MTTTTSTNELTIMKTDKRGRVLTPPEQREAWLDAFEQSGMSGAAFAKLHGIRYTTFANWRTRRKQQSRNNETAAPFFEEIDVQFPHAGSGGLKVALPGGASVDINRAEQFPMVAALLKYLEHSC